jgi:hypothetical protein
MRNVDPLGATVSVGAIAPVALRGRRRVRFVRCADIGFADSQLGVCRGAVLRSCLWLLGLASHDGLGLLRACSKEQLAQPANRGVFVFHQVGHIGVRLEDRTNQLRILLVERLFDTTQDVVQLGVVHFDNLRRVSHPATTGSKSGRPRP